MPDPNIMDLLGGRPASQGGQGHPHHGAGGQAGMAAGHMPERERQLLHERLTERARTLRSELARVEAQLARLQS